MIERNDGQSTQGAGSPKVPQELQDKDLGALVDIADVGDGEEVVASAPDSPAEQLSAWVDHTHEYVRHYIALADQKAAFVFAASTAMLVYLYGAGALSLWQRGVGEWGVWSVVAGGSTLLLTLAGVCAAVAVWPRLAGRADGLVYWGAVARHSSADEYYQKLKASSGEELVREKAQHVFELAGVCDRKYRWVTLSVWASALGFGAAILLILSGAV